MKRYVQQMILPEIGVNGQDTLLNSSVLVVGAGGLGVVVASYLVSMGIGKVGICDFDLVGETNLHRQFLYTPDDIGQKKATVLAQKSKLQNPDVTINVIIEKIDETNVDKIALNYQIICDCTDQAECRILLDNYCQRHNKPLVHGAVSDWQGYLSVFHYKEKFGLKDLFDTADYLISQTCSIIGINSAICGIIGSYMANETIKVLLGLDNVLEGKLLYINSLKNIFRIIKLQK